MGMNQDIKLIVFPVKDITAAKKVFGKFLGSEPYVDSPYYVGFKTGSLEVGLDPNAQNPGGGGPIAYIDTDNLQERIGTLVEAGAEVLQEPKDVGGGLMVATVKDGDGNILGLRQSA
jgi:predicted enzyme related to lactoylglutathione lyase